jgi:hypothetical protein
MNNTRKSQQKSRVSQNTTGLTDRTPNSTNKSAISTIAGDFGRNCQNTLNFAAHISLYPVQKSDFSGGVE